MSSSKKEHITIIGAGLAGSFLALMLAKRGYTVDVYERSREDEIMSDYTSGRSYNLTFYDYGVSVLQKAGLWDTIKPNLVLLTGAITQISQNPPRYTKDKPYYAVERGRLLHTFITAAKKFPGVKFHFGINLVSINRQEKIIILSDTTTQKNTTVPAEVIFGADGANSQVRPALQQAQAATHIQEYADWEYKQIHVSAQMTKELDLQKDIMYAWTRKNAIILAHPNIDESFSALLIVPKNSEHGYANLTSDSAISNYFKKNFPDFMPAIQSVTHDLLNNPTSYFVTIYTQPWYYKNFMVILGDAAHGFNPFYGQGVSAAFADCMTITELLDKYGPDWGKIFPKYQEARKKHTDALATLSKESIAQYRRHKKADFASIYNKLDVTLYTLLPNLFAPPPYVHIQSNPLFAGDYLEKHLKQRKKAKMIGIPVLVGIVTGLVAVGEIMSRSKRSSQ